MRAELIMLAAIAIVIVLAVLEVIAAILPLLIVLTLVPPDERTAVAQLLAAVDSSRRLRLWPALRAAVAARRSIAARSR